MELCNQGTTRVGPQVPNPVNGGTRIGSLGETRRGRPRRSGDPTAADDDNFRDGWGQGSAHGGHRRTLPALHHAGRARVPRGTDWEHSPGEPPARPVRVARAPHCNHRSFPTRGGEREQSCLQYVVSARITPSRRPGSWARTLVGAHTQEKRCTEPLAPVLTNARQCEALHATSIPLIYC